MDTIGVTQGYEDQLVIRHDYYLSRIGFRPPTAVPDDFAPFYSGPESR